MSNLKKKVLAVAAALALALIMGAYSDGLEVGDGTANATIEMLQIAEHTEEGNGGG